MVLPIILTRLTLLQIKCPYSHNLLRSKTTIPLLPILHLLITLLHSKTMMALKFRKKQTIIMAMLSPFRPTLPNHHLPPSQGMTTPLIVGAQPFLALAPLLIAPLTPPPIQQRYSNI